MSQATSIKDAIKTWEQKHPNEDITKATDIGFQFQFPPIQKMDNSLAALACVEKLSLSTNMIDKIGGLSSLKHLKILALGRNNIKSLAGLEGVAETLEQLWISYNQIEKLKGIGVLKKLQVLYMSNNLVKEWAEFNRLQELTVLEDLVFVGNPLCENLEESLWKGEVVRRLPNLKKLEGEPILRD